nr:tail fiber protein [uncultured Fluviicola sp.]
MSTEPFIGEVKLFGFNFAPKGYATCQGQILSIAQNTALFSLLGTTYGGNGQTTFALPDLQGRMAIGQGTGPGLPSHSMGEVSGTPNVTLLTSNIPPHIHPAAGITVQVPVSSGGGDQSDPTNGFIANQGTDIYSSVSTAGKFYGPVQVAGNTGVTGSGLPFSVMNPYLVMNYSIALQGIFPSRN